MLKKVREILAMGLLSLVLGAGLAVVLCVGALAVLVHPGKDHLNSGLCGGLFGTGGVDYEIEQTERMILMKKKLFALLAVLLLAVALTGCTEAEKVNYNITKQAGYFECERRVTVYNARTDNVILYIEGYIDISNNSSSELIVTCKVGPTEYKKNYVYLNDYTLYVVEDINGTHTDPYHYKVYFHTDVLPSVEVRP